MKTASQIVAAMNEWLSTPNLTFTEAVTIRTLKIAAERRGPTEFYSVARHLFSTAPTSINNAIDKARAAGRCKEWTIA